MYDPRPWSERLWARIEVGAYWECWPIAGARNSHGYGTVKINGVTYAAHRLVWEYTYGPIPDGLWVLHHCDNPPCCNIDEHLFLGTNADNSQDRDAKGRGRESKKTHCPQGHPYSGDNLYVGANGKRYCRACNRENQRQWRARQS